MIFHEKKNMGANFGHLSTFKKLLSLKWIYCRISRISIPIRGDKTFQTSLLLFICLFLIVSFIYQSCFGWFGAVSTNGTVFVVNVTKRFKMFFMVENLENRNFKSILSFERQTQHEVSYNMLHLAAKTIKPRQKSSCHHLGLNNC